jgi:hypothetical protein
MSHFAEIDNNNKVIRVLVGDNNESDEGQTVIESLGGTWIKTSFNSKIRGNYAGIGFDYLPDLDIFMPPKCHDEAVLDEILAKWLCNNPDHDIKLPTD